MSLPRLDGDAWVECAQGHRHWGRFGAAGLLLRADGPDGTPHLLLQHRALWSHHGGTWGLPGGARSSTEDAVTAALRECSEETGLDSALAHIRSQWSDDHGGWSYVTVLATADRLVEVAPLAQESIAVEWVAEDDVDTLPLHPGFAATWPMLQTLS